MLAASPHDCLWLTPKAIEVGIQPKRPNFGRHERIRQSFVREVLCRERVSCAMGAGRPQKAARGKTGFTNPTTEIESPARRKI